MKKFFKTYYKQLIIALIFIIFLIGGILVNVFKKSNPTQNEDIKENYINQIKVTIKGEVKYPNSYYIEEGSSVKDLIILASGLTNKANTSFINLNRELKDGETIFITKLEGENEKRININNASLEELKTLNGFGETLAYNIIVYRSINGPFNEINDLLKVNGMSIKIISQNINEITLS